jgi:hypothetical protein
MDKKSIGEVILSVLFLIYLILGTKTPHFMAEWVDSLYGKVIVVLIALILFLKTNPILGILGFFVAYQLIGSSMTVTGTYGLEEYLPTEKKKYSEMTEYNQFPYTLEQEVVKKMAPINRAGYSSTNVYSFHPVLDNLHNASSVHK